MKNDIQPIDFATDPNIEIQTKEFLKAMNSAGAKPIEEMTPAEARAVLTDAQSSVKVDLSGIDVAEKTISQDGLTINISVVRPTGEKETLPVFMFFHGGGWVLGDFQTHKRLIRDLVVQSGTVAVYVDYTLSPEAHYPVAINQAYAATKWVAEHGDEIGVDGKRLALVGNSAGGNMAAVTALMAKDKGGPAIRLQVLFWPATDSNFETTSFHQFGTQRFLTRNLMIWSWDNYAPNKEDRRNKYASPLRASIEELKGLPPALVQVADNDILRDEGEAYARKMNAAGVPVSMVRCLGMIHDYGMLNSLSHIPEVRSLLYYAAAELKKALQ